MVVTHLILLSIVRWACRLLLSLWCGLCCGFPCCCCRCRRRRSGPALLAEAAAEDGSEAALEMNSARKGVPVPGERADK